MANNTNPINENHTGQQTFLDNKFTLLDNDDPSKGMQFQVSGVTAGNVRVVTFPDSDGTLAYTSGGTSSPATLILPGALVPAQTAEGSIVWDTNDDLLTVGDGSSRKTMVDVDSTQAITGVKTLTTPVLTNPVINAGSGTIVLPASASPAQTAEGSIVWDSDDDLLTVGDGSGRKTMVDVGSTQSVTGVKTFTTPVLTNPVVNAGSGTVVLPASASPAQTAEGSIVWDSDDDLLTVGDGSGRKTMVDVGSTQAITGVKTLTTPVLTDPVVNAGSGTVVLPTSASPAQTAEGSVVWDSDDDLLTVGDGTGRKTMVDVSSTQSVTGAKTFTTAHISAGNLTPTTVNRTSQQYVVNDFSRPGTTAGWLGSVLQVDNLGLLATCPQLQTAATLIIPITNLKVGWTVTGYFLSGQIESGGNAVTLDADLRKMTSAAADFTDASIGAITQISVTADTLVDASNSTKTLAAPEVIAADEILYLKLTATTAAATDIGIGSVVVIVTEV